MIVIKAKTMGMCMGVRKAEKAALGALEAGKAEGRKVLSYGPLIHNPQAVAELERRGLGVLDPADFAAGAADAGGAIVVIRAHGAPPEVFAALAAAGSAVVDATCPRVLASQKRARKLASEGWSVAIAGDRSHDEVAGILGCAPGSAVLQDGAEASRLAQAWAGHRVALLAQTTIKRSEYEAIAAALSATAAEFLAVDSLCPATLERQEALSALAAEAEAIVVVGGRNSANTKRLLLSAAASGKPAWQVETAAELPTEIYRFGKVGISAGASTPDFVVEAVERALLAGKPQ